MAAMKRIGRLAVGIVDVQERVADGRAEALVPVVVQKRDHAPHRQCDAFDRPARISAGSQFNADVDRCIVHVVLNSLAKDKGKAAGIVRREFEVRSEIESRSDFCATEVKLIVDRIDPFDSPDHSGGLEVTPVASEANVAGEVGQVKLRSDALQLDAIRKDTLIATRARTFECKRYGVAALQRHPAKLQVAEEHHAVWSPILERVWKHIDIHERTPRLTGAELAQLAVSAA